MAESTGARVARRVRHFAAHPIAWARYVWKRELLGREVLFRENPRFLDWRPMYRLSRTPLADVLEVPPATLDPFFEELAPLHAALLADVGGLPSAGALIQAPLLYVLARATRPAWIVETGISSGYSARLLLEALRANGGGHLDSVGIDLFALQDPSRPDASGLGGRKVGWLVPEALYPYWGLHLGRSEEVLPALLAAGDAPLDLFLHDSLHQPATMRWEYATGTARLRPGGLLLSHDIHANAAWPTFLAERGIRRSADLDHDLGIARVDGPPSGTSPR